MFTRRNPSSHLGIPNAKHVFAFSYVLLLYSSLMRVGCEVTYEGCDFNASKREYDGKGNGVNTATQWK